MDFTRFRSLFRVCGRAFPGRRSRLPGLTLLGVFRHDDLLTSYDFRPCLLLATRVVLRFAWDRAWEVEEAEGLVSDYLP
jgi:hypothetical protein